MQPRSTRTARGSGTRSYRSSDSVSPLGSSSSRRTIGVICGKRNGSRKRRDFLRRERLSRADTAPGVVDTRVEQLIAGLAVLDAARSQDRFANVAGFFEHANRTGIVGKWQGKQAQHVQR